MTQQIKTTKIYSLNKGSGAANGLYNVSENSGSGLSFWFDNETKKSLQKLTAHEFNNKCKELIELS